MKGSGKAKKPMVISAFVLILAFYQGVLAYEAITVSGAGTIKGGVAFKGSPPPPKRMLITKDKEVCGEGYREIREVEVKNSGLGGVVVFIDGIQKGKAWKEPAKEPAWGGYVLDQKGCVFIPYIQVVPKGVQLIMRNSDPVLHNTHAYELIGTARRTLFNLAQPNPGDITKEIKLRREQQIKVECDAHDFMHAWIFVADNPYYQVTDEKGSFEIGDVPPGTYKLKVWHPTLGAKEKEVKVADGAKVEVSFEF